jgi:hypothetical protein
MLISLVPFSASLLGSYSNNELSIIIFGIHIICIGLVLFWMRRYVLYSPEIQNPEITKEAIAATIAAGAATTKAFSDGMKIWWKTLKEAGVAIGEGLKSAADTTVGLAEGNGFNGSTEAQESSGSASVSGSPINPNQHNNDDDDDKPAWSRNGWKHMMERHGPDAQIGDKSKYLKGIDIKKIADETIEFGKQIKQGTDIVYEHTFKYNVGTTQTGALTQTNRVIIDTVENVIKNSYTIPSP